MSDLDRQDAPTFPPLMAGEEVTGQQDPFEIACLRATQGVDAGLVLYRLDATSLEAALVFAPEVPLARAMAMLPLCGVGFQNALGALAPPEVAVHLEWNGAIRVNGARCGQLRVMASDPDPQAVPDWLVVALSVTLLPKGDAPGLTPDETSLFAEGCADVAPPRLLEAWARHTLNWITRWEVEGAQALHAEWRGLAHGMGEEITQGDHSGTFLGVDEDFGILIRAKDTTQLIPLTTQLEAP
ncbi:biotin/lipoate--protein ligase family protein [Tropicibacter oceani]|uniref:DUF4444 domain-containing protein n=1 Tax=Tropicibacter oceani TaxID=3058420 RepID=A0ABY8QLM8_9RHOB|nr:biotin/lipoate--protein ligase family protein [Tropicibacter oceani]WGW05546.1 DUF4444 domain-containing protein [Tropicibacter oceani]